MMVMMLVTILLTYDCGVDDGCCYGDYRAEYEYAGYGDDNYGGAYVDDGDDAGGYGDDGCGDGGDGDDMATIPIRLCGC